MDIDANTLLLSLLCGGGVLLLIVVGVVISIQNRQADMETGAPAARLDSASLQPVGFTPSASPDLARRAEAMLKSGDKAGAIRLYQESAGLGLREASDAVEAIEKRIYHAQFTRATPKVRLQEVEDLVKSGRRIEAVRLYAEANQTGLLEAMRVVVAIGEELENR